MRPGNQFQAFFNFQIILCKMESEEVSMLIWINFDSFAITYLRRLLQKFHFSVVVVNSLETQKGLELVFRPHFLQNFLMKLFLLEYDINWPNYINRPCLLPKLFSKIYFWFYAQAFDDVIKFEHLKYQNLIFSRTKRAFEVK